MDTNSALVGAFSVFAVWVVKEVFVPDLLDRHKQRRTAELQRAAELRAYEREDAPVRARIMSAALEMLRLLQRVFVEQSALTIDQWRSVHEKLYQLVDCDSGARALGESYLSVMEALNYDQLLIDVQSKIESSATSASDAVGEQRYALVVQNVAAALLHFVPVLERVTGDFDGEEFASSALTAMAIAHQRLIHLPDSNEL